MENYVFHFETIFCFSHLARRIFGKIFWGGGAD
jgi:hypothetical protein